MLSKQASVINRKCLQNNWYYNSHEKDSITQEAGVKETFRNISYAVALLISGLSIHEVSQRYKIPPEVIEEASQNPNIREEVEKLLSKESLPENTLPVPTDNIPAIQQKTTSSYDVAQTKQDVIFYETDGMSEDKRYVYYDSKNIPTIGIGINLSDPVQQRRITGLGYDVQKLLSKQQSLNWKHVQQLFDESYQQAEKDAITFFPKFRQLDPIAQSALVDMSYNMGRSSLSGFQKLSIELLKALQTGDYSRAADEMRDSDWFDDTGRRGRTQSDRVQGIGK